MRILYIVRNTLFSDPGGDTVQIKNTAGELIKSGLEITIKKTSEKIDYSNFDLIHFFNLIRPQDILKHIRLSKKPFIVSTIFVDYSQYEKISRNSFPGSLLKLLSGNQIEYIKNIAKFFLKGERIESAEYIFLGHKKAIQKIINKAAYLLPNSESEYKRIQQSFGGKTKYAIVPNGIDPVLFPDNCNTQKDPLILLCIGRIEGRKNQLNLIRAVNNSAYTLYIIGKPAQNQKEYYEQCKKEAGRNIHFINALPQEELIPYLEKAKIHILPSWFETTGLSTLEAAWMRCNIVITDKGDTRDYFEDYAYYCDPSDVFSIRTAIDKASAAPFPEALKLKIKNHFTWHHARSITASIYKSIAHL